MSKKRHNLPSGTRNAQIECFSHDGRGIARIDGKTTFIQGALPEEEVSFQYTRIKPDFDEGKVINILSASPGRVEPVCPHYSLCGGCTLQHLKEEQQIHEKQSLLLNLLSRIGHCKPEVVLPPLTARSWYYRNRARLNVRYVEKKSSVLIGFHEKNNPRFITEISQCPILNKKVDREIINLRALINSFANPRIIAQIGVAVGDEEVALVFRNLYPLAPEDGQKLYSFGKRTGFRLFLQPGGNETVKLFYPKDGAEFLSYALPEQNLQFHFHPSDFTQVNARLNQLLVAQTLQLFDLQPQDIVLDLFCGLGNFSLAMARYCAKVVGIEGSAAMVSRAQMNAHTNHLDNTEFLCADLAQNNPLRELGGYGFTKILLDPPRTGAFEIVKNIRAFKGDQILYISCNPATFARDADILVNQNHYRLKTIGAMDMFPHTAHVESIALFERIKSHG
jgi:23S rRNA (uracil1939-C5)-methyltransferase